MGIPKFLSWASQRVSFKKAFVRLPSAQGCFLGIDANSMVHSAAQSVYGYGEDGKKGEMKLSGSRRQKVIELSFERIKNLITLLRPAVTYIALDGTPPHAKIIQQRSRRFGNKEDIPFNTTEITPGTRFMNSLDKYYEENLDDLQVICDVILSTAGVPGEGEQKIASFLREKGDNLPDKIVIAGDDSDLFMIYLTIQEQQPTKHTYLLRRFNQGIPNQIIDLLVIYETIRAEFRTQMPAHDFVALMMLNGNDFLEHFPSLEVIPQALESLYQGYIQFVRKNRTFFVRPENPERINTISYKRFLKFFNENYRPTLFKDWSTNSAGLIQYPSKLVSEASKTKPMYDGPYMRKYTIIDEDDFRCVWYRNAVSSKSKVSEAVVEDMAKRYLETLRWVYAYFTRGEMYIDWSWCYGYHYNPLLPDVEKHMNTEVFEEETKYIQNRVSTYAHLAMVVPKELSSLLPKDLRKKVKSKTSSLSYLYPVQYIVDHDGKMSEYQKISRLPIPSVDDVNELLD